MKVLVTYSRSNGYECSCCRDTWEESEIFDIGDENPVVWINKHKFSKENDCCEVLSVYKLADDYILYEWYSG